MFFPPPFLIAHGVLYCCLKSPNCTVRHQGIFFVVYNLVLPINLFPTLALVKIDCMNQHSTDGVYEGICSLFACEGDLAVLSFLGLANFTKPNDLHAIANDRALSCL